MGDIRLIQEEGCLAPNRHVKRQNVYTILLEYIHSVFIKKIADDFMKIAKANAQAYAMLPWNNLFLPRETHEFPLYPAITAP